MTLKDLKTLSRRFPRRAKLKFKSKDTIYDNFSLELKYNSEEGWIVVVLIDDPQ